MINHLFLLQTEDCCQIFSLLAELKGIKKFSVIFPDLFFWQRTRTTRYSEVTKMHLDPYSAVSYTHLDVYKRQVAYRGV